MELGFSTTRKEKFTLVTISSTHEIQTSLGERQSGTWGAALLAGLPHLLVGLLLGWSGLLTSSIDPDQRLGTVFGIGLAILVVTLLIAAWLRGWPLWSASWYLYGTWIVLVILGQVIEKLNLEESWRYSYAMLVGWLIFCIIGYFSLSLKSKLHALLAIAFLFPFIGIALLEFIPDSIEGWLAIALGLLVALVSGAIVRGGDFRTALGLVLGVNIVSGLVLAYISEYMPVFPQEAPIHIPKFSNFLDLLVLYTIFGLGIVALPFILRSLWNFGKSKFAS
jgi:hypothetical protein